MAADRKAIVVQINDGFANNDLEKVLSFCTEGFSWNMVGDRKVTGKQAIRQWMKSIPPEPPQFTIDRMVAEGDFVITRGDMTMKNKEGAIDPYSFCDMYHFSGDQVDELITFAIKTDKQVVGV